MSIVSTFEELVKAAKAKGYQLDEEKVRLKEDEPLLKSGFGFPLPAIAGRSVGLGRRSV